MYIKKKYLKKFYNKKIKKRIKIFNFSKKSIKIYLIIDYFFNIFLAEKLIPLSISNNIFSSLEYIKIFNKKIFKKRLKLFIKPIKFIPIKLKYIFSIYAKLKYMRIKKFISKKSHIFYSKKIKLNKIRSYNKRFF